MKIGTLYGLFRDDDMVQIFQRSQLIYQGTFINIPYTLYHIEINKIFATDLGYFHFISYGECPK